MSKEQTVTVPLSAQTDVLTTTLVGTGTPAQRTLPLLERLWHVGAVRKGLVLALLLGIWQLYAVRLENPLFVPTFTDTCRALASGFASGELLPRIGVSLKVLLGGYVIGIVLAGILTILAVTSRFGSDVLETLTAMFN
ncbi:MAG TPA: ABC transporter permease, partial [Geobacteraceae bacterium]